MVKRLIIDTDPGIDDALALIAAVRCQDAELLGVSVVAGNLPLETVKTNASAILVALNSPARVYPGASGPLYGMLQDASDIHGPGGLGGWQLPPDPRRIDSCHGAEYIAKTAATFPGEVILVTLGPLTNLALALEHHPREVEKLAGVVMMGGALGVQGNVTPVAEFNLWADADAAQVVLDSGLNLSMVGLNVTRDMVLEQTSIPALAQGDHIAQGAARMIKYIVAKEGEYPFHDPLALTAALRPEFFTWNTVPIAIETRSPLCRGQIIAGRDGEQGGKVKMATAADYRQCRDFLLGLWQSLEQ
jgi:inosine-uridine nucleoside N-ribohydrolase